MAPNKIPPSRPSPFLFPDSSAPRFRPGHNASHHPHPNIRLTRRAAAHQQEQEHLQLQLQLQRQRQLQQSQPQPKPQPQPQPQPPPNRFLCLNELPRMPASHSPAPVKRMPGEPVSPFLRLPTEIRLQIYSLLVLPRRGTDLIENYEKVACSTQDYYDYEKTQNGTNRPAIADLSSPTLLIRNYDPKRYSTHFSRLQPHTRSTYAVRSDRFRNRCMQTTYHCVNNPRIEDQLGILRTNKQIHAEAAELLYSSYTFDFDTHVEAIVPFFSDLTPTIRSCIKSIRFVKRALPYDKEFDRAEWSTALRYLTSSNTSVALRRLELGIVAGKPQPSGWDRVARHSAADFRLLKDFDGMEWMQYLLEFRDLEYLSVDAVVEHCPPATSSMAMANFIRFSASIEDGFKNFLRQELLGHS